MLTLTPITRRDELQVTCKVYLILETLLQPHPQRLQEPKVRTKNFRVIDYRQPKRPVI